MQTNESNQTSHSSNPLRQLIDKIVFLDLNNYKPINKVKECFESLGVDIADCLSKEVNFVITNRETSDSTCSTFDKKTKTSPNAFSMVSSRVSAINRTQAILEKASKHTALNDILSTAKRLGIKVISIVELERYIEKYMLKLKNLNQQESANTISTPTDKTKSTNEKTSNFKGTDSLITKVSPKQTSLAQTTHKICKLKAPFLKFESICKQYRPNYQEFNVWHELNFDSNESRNTMSPFQVYFSDDEKEDDENGDNGCNLSSSQTRLNEEDPIKRIKSPTSSNAIGSKTQCPPVLSNCSNSILKLKSNTNSNSICSRRNSSNKLSLNSAFLNQFQTKRKTVGYCECCKQKFDNLNQHLSSAQHENFDRNMNNFKEIDKYIDCELNFRNYLVKNNLEMCMNSETSINIDEIKLFAKNFNQRRRSLGLSHVQVIQSLDETDKDPIYNEINLARFERLDITPRSTAKMKSTLEKWLVSTETKLNERFKTYSLPPLDSNMHCNNESDTSKKRKRTSLTPRTLQALNEAFNLNSQPNENEISQLSIQINYDKDLIRLWFNDKAKNVKKKIKKYKQETVLLGLTNESFMNTSTDINNSFSPSSTAFQSCQKTKSNKISISNITSNSQTNTPKLKQRALSLASSLSLSSPTGASLLLSHNSFVTNDLNNSGKRLNGSKLLASRIELINGSSHVQSIIADDLKKKYEDSTELSFVDDDLYTN